MHKIIREQQGILAVKSSGSDPCDSAFAAFAHPANALMEVQETAVNSIHRPRSSA